MKKTVEATPENLRTLKQRLLAIVAMLLIALILTMLTSFAWLTMSIAPEVSGIVSNIGANGSLEMALLNSDTYSNPAIIKNPNIGESLESDSEVANERWGNLINLDGTSYGLEKIKLYPARLNAKKSANGLSYTLGDSILSIPSYGYDGRIVSLSDNTVSGIYTDKDFSYDVSNLGFGVRAIGTTNNLSIQANYLLKARGNILSYTTSAKTSAISSFSGMENLLIKVASGSNSFNNSDVTTLKTMISRLQEAENYIEKALRQGLVGYAAANLADEKAFEMARSEIDNDKSTLSLLVRVVEEITTINSSFETWVNQHEVMQNALARASATCAALTDDAHTM